MFDVFSFKISTQFPVLEIKKASVEFGILPGAPFTDRPQVYIASGLRPPGRVRAPTKAESTDRAGV